MNLHPDISYINLVKDVLENGVERGDRTGTGTIGVFSRQMRFDLTNDKIPMLTTKKMHTRSIIHEILWYLQGNTNVKYLQDNGVRIWNEWADENGELGPVYGAQWRKWPKYTIKDYDEGIQHSSGAETFFNAKVTVEYVDQIGEIVDKLKNNPFDRRILVSAWNVGQIEDMALPPCHYAFQFWANIYTPEERMDIFKKRYPTASGETNGYIDKEKMFETYDIPRGELSCMLNQRSCDVGLGVPFNIVQYSILTHMIAQVTGLEAKEFVWSGGDVHIYKNHIDIIKTQLDREPFDVPTLVLNKKVNNIDEFTFEDFEIVGYESHPTIKMEVSV